MEYVTDLQEFLVIFAPLALAGAGVALGALIIVVLWTAIMSLFSDE